MVPIVVRPGARNDQLEIAEYYDAEGGEALGNRFIQQCDAGFERLSQFPESGTLVRYKHVKLEDCRFISFRGSIRFRSSTKPNGTASRLSASSMAPGTLKRPSIGKHEGRHVSPFRLTRPGNQSGVGGLWRIELFVWDVNFDVAAGPGGVHRRDHLQREVR